MPSPETRRSPMIMIKAIIIITIMLMGGFSGDAVGVDIADMFISVDAATVGVWEDKISTQISTFGLSVRTPTACNPAWQTHLYVNGSFAANRQSVVGGQFARLFPQRFFTRTHVHHDNQ